MKNKIKKRITILYEENIKEIPYYCCTEKVDYIFDLQANYTFDLLILVVVFKKKKI